MRDHVDLIHRLWAFVETPRFALSPLRSSPASSSGVAFTALELTNREEFCISCHECATTCSSSTATPSTIRTAPACAPRARRHVPRMGPKIIRKIQASNEVLHKLLGSIGTPEKFNAKRAELAGPRKWARMKANDSPECRNCHNYSYMDYAEQNRRSAASTRWRSTKARPASTATGHRAHAAVHRAEHRCAQGWCSRDAPPTPPPQPCAARRWRRRRLELGRALARFAASRPSGGFASSCDQCDKWARSREQCSSTARRATKLAR
ncbi:MAG: NapC/NirT family cytochrome c [Ideonella sp.]|nr:NapC/NirT family cytochrome c [Ideonella sp.]